MDRTDYVHGYSEREAERLNDQARTLTSLLHNDTRYPAGSRVLEAGCGTGAQTVILAKNSPGAEITSIDISPDPSADAEERVRSEGIENVTFRAGAISSASRLAHKVSTTFLSASCWNIFPIPRALASLRPLIRPGGTITVIEGDHGSAYFHPDSAGAAKGDQVPGRSPAGGRG